MNLSKKLSGIVMVLFLVFNSLIVVSAAEDQREAEEIEFEDTKNLEWAKEYIARMKAEEIFQGYDDGSFRPNNPVTRMQAIITAVRLLGLEEEAQSKSLETKLHFKDAEYFEKNQWAKGYIIVALENGLFDVSEEEVLPNQPAKRLWISSLLVRALGLEEEALKAMTEIPDFKDADQIPAGAIGFVNIANEYEIFTGTDEGFFKPNANITRAQMAAVLDRTFGKLLEENGAMVITGVVRDISFTEGENSGSISIETYNGDVTDYQIPKDLFVQFHNRFMNADQILAGDHIELYMENDTVLEAAIFEEKTETEVNTGIQEIKVELEFGNDEKFELKFNSDKGKVTGEIEIEMEGLEKEYKGEQASQLIEEYLSSWNLSPDMNEDEIEAAILGSLEISDSVKELEIKVNFANGTKMKVEREHDKEDEEENDEDSDDTESAEVEGYNGIVQVDLQIELKDRSAIAIEYKHEEDELEASIIEKTKQEANRIKGEEAQAQIEDYLDEMDLTTEMDQEEILQSVLRTFNLNENDIKELEMTVKFSVGEKVEIELENDLDDEEEEEEEDEDKEDE